MTLDLEAIFGHDTPTLGNAADPTAGDQSDPSAPVTIRAELTPDGFRLLCPAAELAAAIEAGRPTLENLLAELVDEREAPTVPPLSPDGWPADSVEPGEPCPDCGSLEKWWDVAGGEHCGRCEARALVRSLELSGRAARLRRIARPARGEAGPTAETASRLAPCREETATDDTLRWRQAAGRRDAGGFCGARNWVRAHGELRQNAY